MKQAYIIGEAGSCHDGKPEQAHALIQTAKNAGVDAVKFQFYHSGVAVAKRRKAPQFAEMYERYRMPKTWLPILLEWAHDAGLHFICTTYMDEDIRVVAPYVDAFKIASLESLNTAFIK